MEDPALVLDELRSLMVLDEVQRHPDIFPVLRVLADRRPRPARFLVLGRDSHRLANRVRTVAAGRLHKDLGL